MAKTYDTYKDSGIAWIDMIPKGWRALPFKSIFYTEKGLNITKADLTETGVPVLSYGQIHSKQNTGTYLNEELFKFVPRSYLKTNPECLVQKGCLLIADTSEDYEGCGNAIYVDSNKTLFAGYHTIIARPYNIGRDYKYFAYLLLTDNWRQQVRSCVSGIKVYSVNQKILKQTSVLFPPLPEQEAIATYLDEKCGEIDSLISLQEEMISELQAYKQSVITEAVTKGLDLNVPMKDSGVEWIGTIPEGWNVSSLKHIINGHLQYGANESGTLFEEGLPRYVRITDILDNKLREDIQKQSLTEEQASGFILQDKDILFARSGGTVGKSFIYRRKYGRCAFAGYLIKAAINQKNDADFIYYYTLSSSYDEWKKRIFIQATIQNIGADKYSLMEIPLPPLSEQQAIASYLDEKTSQIDSLIALKLEKITELKDYKKSIIYEYVTGKKKV